MRNATTLGLALTLLALACPAKAEGFSDPVAYCRAVGTIDRPDARYGGPKRPAWIAAKLRIPVDLPFVWRCAKGEVLACAFGANIPCESKAVTNRRPSRPIRDFCRRNPDAPVVPMVVTGHDAAVSWRCHGARPVALSSAPVDEQGYVAAYWTRVSPP